MSRTLRPVAFLLATTALAAALAGCKPDNSPPPAAVVSGTPPLGPLDPGAAPAANAPVAAAPAAQVYAYPQRAYQLSRVVHQRPPSYAFGYGDAQPYVWDDGGQGEMFAEPVDDGYRYYYYEPGEDYPYFVQDPDYGYAYGPNGALIALFAATGALIAADHWHDYAPQAGAYWTRGYDLDRAYRHSTRYPVLPAVWRERAPAFYAGHDRWFRAAQAQPGWRQAAAWSGTPGHDNGRHLGWFKDHGGDHGGGRQFAVAGPPAQRFQPQRQAPPVRAEHKQTRNDHGWRQARQDRPAQAAAAPHGRGGPAARPNQGGQGWREAHASAAPQPAPQPHGPRPGGDHGGWNRSHGGESHGGGQALARAAPQPQAHGGGPGWRGGVAPHEGGGHGPGGEHHGGNPGGGGQAFARAAPQQQSHGGGPHGGGGGRGPGGGAPSDGQGRGGGAHGGGDKGGGHGHDR